MRKRKIGSLDKVTREIHSQLIFEERPEDVMEPAKWVSGERILQYRNSKHRSPQAGALTEFSKEQEVQCGWSGVKDGASGKSLDERGDKGVEHVESCFYFLK